MSDTAIATSSDYVVGYGRPPKEHQFSKGQSGNPAGRAKGSQNFDTTLRAALNERVAVTIDGKRMEIPKYQVIASQLVNQAASGVFSALKLGIEMWRDLDHRDAQAAAMQRDDPDRLANDNAILMAHNLRVVAANKSKTAKPATNA
jgi:hypothetical protein